MHLVSRTLGHNAKISYDRYTKGRKLWFCNREGTQKIHLSGVLELGRHDIKLIHTSLGSFMVYGRIQLIHRILVQC